MANFDSVEILSTALHVAGVLRSTGRAEAALANAFVALGLDLPLDSDPLPARIVQLILKAGEDRQSLYEYLRSIEGHLGWDRPPTPPEQVVELVQEDEVARQLVELLQNEQLGPGYSMFWRQDGRPAIPSFRLLNRSSVLWFDGPMVVRRGDQELSPSEATPPQPDDEWQCKPLELPKTVRGLIDYPFEIATLFEIDTGVDPWDVWDICCAFSDQYLKLYECPEKYGIWGADLSSLWIEDLLYYPDHELIYPYVGS